MSTHHHHSPGAAEYAEGRLAKQRRSQTRSPVSSNQIPEIEAVNVSRRAPCRDQREENGTQGGVGSNRQFGQLAMLLGNSRIMYLHDITAHPKKIHSESR